MATKRKQSFNIQKKSIKGTLREYLIGKKIEILGGKGGHNYGSVGDTFVVEETAMVYGNTFGNNAYLSNALPGGNAIYFTEFTVLGALTKKDIEEENRKLRQKIEDIKSEIEDNKSKIKFMEEMGSKEYDENEYKAYRTLELVEDPTLSRAKKAKLIAELIN